MDDTILFVDDDPQVLAAYRWLRAQYAVETAHGPDAALSALAERGPFAVVVSDLTMPGMNGIEFLSRVRGRAPDSVRVLITGNADLGSAIQAVNDGHVFRFLTKPCSIPALTQALDACLRQYRLVAAEKDLLEKTLRGSVTVLSEVLALASPLAFGRAVRAQRYTRDVAAALGAGGDWATDVAALLSQVGCVTVPEAVLAKAHRGEPLTAAEARMLDAHPAAGADLVRAVPRLEGVAEVIAYQNQRFAGPPLAGLEKCGADIPLGARLLKVALDFDELVGRDLSKPAALERLAGRTGWYDPAVVAALGEAVRRQSVAESRQVDVHQLVPGMVLAADLYSRSGTLLLSKGHTISEPLVRRLQNIADHGALSGPIPVTTDAG